MKPRPETTTARRSATLILAGSILALLGSGAAQAASQAWTGGSTTDGSWATTANWGNNTPPGATSGTTSTDIATFNAAIVNTWGNSAANPVVVDLNQRIIGGINFDLAAGNYFIGSTGGNNLRLSDSGTIKISNTLTATNLVATVNAPLSLYGSYTLRNDSANGSGAGAGTLNFGGHISGGGGSGTRALTLDGSNTNANLISGIISGVSVSVSKSGAGTWLLSAGNTYTGRTTINGGLLTLAFGSVSTDILPIGTLLTLGGGTLRLTGTGTQVVNGLTISSALASRIVLGANETFTLPGSTSAGTGSALNFNTAVGGSNGAAVGTGVVVLSGRAQGTPINSGFTVSDAGGFGLATVNGVDQVIRSAAPTLLPASGGSSATDYTINNNAGGATAAGSSTLAVTASQSAKSLTVDTTTTAGVVTLNPNVTLSTSTFNFGGVGSNPWRVTGGNGINPLNPGDTIYFNNYNAGPVTINTPVMEGNGTSSVVVRGGGTVVFSAANSYSGSTTINTGTLEVASGGVINNSSTIGIGTNDGDVAAFKISGGSVTTASVDIARDFSSASGTATVSAGSWQISGGLTVGRDGAGVLNLTGGNIVDDTGTIANVTGAVGTATVSGGTWTNNTLTVGGNGGKGVLTLTGPGVVQIGGTLSLGTFGGTGTLNVGAGGTAGTLNANTVDGGSGTATVNFNQTGAYAFAPKLSGALTVNKLGSGTTTLTAASTYTGATTVSAGALVLAFGATTTNILPSTTPLTLGNATLQLTGTGTQAVSGLKIASGATRILLGASETLTLGSLTAVAAGSALNFNVAAGGGNASLSTVGTSLVGLSGQTLGAVINNQFTVTDAGGFGLASVNGSNQIVRLTNTTLLPASGASSATNYLINNNAGGAAAAGSSTLTVTASETTLSNTVDTTAAAGVVTLNSGVVLNTSIWNFGGANSNTWQITGSAAGAGIGAATFNNFNPGAVTFNTPVKTNVSIISDVVVRGTGTLIFSAANTYTSNTLVQGGTLQVATGGSISAGSASVTVGSVNGDVGTLNLTGGNVSNGFGYVGSSAGSSGTVTISAGSWTNSLELYIGLSGTGVLNLTGGTLTNRDGNVGSAAGSSGTMTMSAGTWTNNSYLYIGDRGTGVFNLSGGSVSNINGYLGANNGSGTATVSGGTWTNSGDLYVGNSGTGLLNLTGTGVVKAGSGTVTVAALSGSTGTLNLGTGGVAGTLQAATVTGGSGTSATVNFNHTGVLSFAPQLTGSLGVNKLGSGTTTLTAAETFTGPTDISQGTLLVSGSLSASAATVETGGTLGGSGTVGPVTVQSGGFLEGGTGAAASGALSSNGSVSLLSGSEIELTLGGSLTHSTLARTGGTWSFDSNQLFTFNALPGATAGFYNNVISGLSGTEAGLASVGNWKIDPASGVTGSFSYDNAGGVDLTVATIPEPGSVALLLASLPLLGLHRRRGARK